MTAATKLHILLITTILGVGLYMFLLFKEIKMFERELADLRIKVQSVAAHLPNMQTLDVVTSATAPGPATASATPPASASKVAVNAPQDSSACPQIAIIADNRDEDDNMSVTSNEIKDILTNIQDIQDVQDVQENQDIQHIQDIQEAEPASPASETASSSPPRTKQIAQPLQQVQADVDLATLSDDQVKALKYDEVRNILRKRGINARGTKAELTNMVLSLKNDATRQ